MTEGVGRRAAIKILLGAIALASHVGIARAEVQPSRVFWGDTHNHTGNSFDVYLFGTPSSTPDTA